jgi:hypothetical protein
LIFRFCCSSPRKSWLMRSRGAQQAKAAGMHVKISSPRQMKRFSFGFSFERFADGNNFLYCELIQYDDGGHFWKGVEGYHQNPDGCSP